MIRYLKIAIGIILLSSCLKSNYNKAEKDNFKYFISEYSIHELHNFDIPQFIIAYDTLERFNQIDSLKERLCSGDCNLSGNIAINYEFQNKTYDISVFPFLCPCAGHGDIFVDFIEIEFIDTNIFISNYPLRMNIENEVLSDSLYAIFTAKFDLYFSDYKHYLNSNASSDEIFNVNSRRVRFCVYSGLNSENEIKLIKKPLDLIIDAYKRSLERSLKDNYNTDINYLDTNEIKKFCDDLHLFFDISYKN